MNAAVIEGLEAGRTLVQHHEPTSATRAAGLVQLLVSFEFDGDIHENLVKSKKDLARCEAIGEECPDNIQLSTFIRRLFFPAAPSFT